MKSSPSKRASNIFVQIEKTKGIKPKPELVIIANGGLVIDSSFFYVSGFQSGLFENSFLLARQNDSVSLFTSTLEESIARSDPRGIEIYAFKDSKKCQEKLKESAGKNVKTIGLNFSQLSMTSFNLIKSLFKGAKMVDVGAAIASARAIKDESEVEAIQKACHIASRVYRKVPGLLKDGITESHVAAEMAYEMQRAGGSGVSFPSIIAFGKNSALPHYTAGGARLKKGQYVLTDYGTTYRRYCSDITRTLVYGRASKEQKRIYSIVKEALEIGTEYCTPEHTGAEVHSKVAKFIDSTEYRGRFIHGTGHSLGLDVHDGPGLSSTVKSKLEPGMVVTVEPGIYVPSLGGVRIEDDVLITKGKPRVLTTAARELIET
ncbi:MAG: M24 family metallopeptidase [Nitrososphaerales archaeon]